MWIIVKDSEGREIFDGNTRRWIECFFIADPEVIVAFCLDHHWSVTLEASND